MRRFLLGIGMALAVCVSQASAAPPELGKGTVVIGMTSWSSSTSITAVGKLLLEKIGYKVETKQLDTGLIYQSLSTGDVDLFFNAWLPGQQSYLNKLGDKIDIVSTSSGPTPGGLLVPSYVNVSSIEQLKDPKVAASLGGKIVGIDAGSGLMMKTKEVLKAYDLNVDLVPSSGAAMTAAFKTAYEKKEPIVVTGWCPTTMCAKYSYKFLDDPKNVYGETRNWHVANKTFRAEHPRATQFISRFTLFQNQQSNIMVWIEDNGMTPEAAAQRFINENKELVWYMIGDLVAGVEKPATMN
jgi:glycine betaine/proline transport system substrate-binding protein